MLSCTAGAASREFWPLPKLFCANAITVIRKVGIGGRFAVHVASWLQCSTRNKRNLWFSTQRTRSSVGVLWKISVDEEVERRLSIL
jgi:hypothetical protein